MSAARTHRIRSASTLVLAIAGCLAALLSPELARAGALPDVPTFRLDVTLSVGSTGISDMWTPDGREARVAR